MKTVPVRWLAAANRGGRIIVALGLVASGSFSFATILAGTAVQAQEQLPWETPGSNDAPPRAPVTSSSGRYNDPYQTDRSRGTNSYRPAPPRVSQPRQEPYNVPSTANRGDAQGRGQYYDPRGTRDQRHTDQRHTDQRHTDQRYIDQRSRDRGAYQAPPTYQPTQAQPPYTAPQRDDRAPPYAEERRYETEPRNAPSVNGQPQYGQPRQSQYDAQYDRQQERHPRTARKPVRQPVRDGTYTSDEIRIAGHDFFGSISQGLASVIEHAFKKQGRPNGYILGEGAGGAFVAGLRYGEGRLYTKNAGSHRVYWQGPSIGYDAGAEGSKTMILVYNLRDPSEIYQRFGGVAGSAYLIGGVGITFQKRDHVILAPIRAGVGLRLGANIGYLKYTRRPTWNPF